MAKAPSFQFYPGDWCKDPALRACSLAARGLWMDMLCLMHEAPERGCLRRTDGTAFEDKQIARQVGCDAEEFARAFAELQANGVFSRTRDGVIYSRRMRRDEELRQVRAEAGRLGGSKSKAKPQANGKQNPKQTGPPSSSSSSSDGSSDPKNPPNPPRGGTGFGEQSWPDSHRNSETLAGLWADFADQRRRSKKPMTAKAAALNAKVLAGLPLSAAIESIEASIRNGWTGVFAPKVNGHSAPPDGKAVSDRIREKYGE